MTEKAYDPKVLVQLRIPAELAKQVKFAAEQNMRSMNNQIIFYVQEGLNREGKHEGIADRAASPKAAA